MTDIALTYDNTQLSGGYSIANGDLATGGDLYNAIYISLLTWRKPANTDLVDLSTYQHGFWADAFTGLTTGSRLYLLQNSKLNYETASRAKTYITEALQWMLDQGVAEQIVVKTDIPALNTLMIYIDIYKTDGTNTVVKFDNLWDMIQANN